MNILEIAGYIDIGVVLVWMFWFWRTIANTLLKPGYPLQQAARDAVPVVVVGLVLGLVSGLLVSIPVTP